MEVVLENSHRGGEKGVFESSSTAQIKHPGTTREGYTKVFANFAKPQFDRLPERSYFGASFVKEGLCWEGIQESR